MFQVCPGGGFGPVSDQGYGVSYMLPGDLRLFFHVSSKKSSEATDSARFVKNLEEALGEMRELFKTAASKEDAGDTASAEPKASTSKEA